MRGRTNAPTTARAVKSVRPAILSTSSALRRIRFGAPFTRNSRTHRSAKANDEASTVVPPNIWDGMTDRLPNASSAKHKYSNNELRLRSPYKSRHSTRSDGIFKLKFRNNHAAKEKVQWNKGCQN